MNYTYAEVRELLSIVEDQERSKGTALWYEVRNMTAFLHLAKMFSCNQLVLFICLFKCPVVCILICFHNIHL